MPIKIINRFFLLNIVALTAKQFGKHMIVMLLFTICICNLNGQELNPGQQLPNILLRHVINYPKDSLSLYDFKGKLMILDFWGTGCLNCIQFFPEMDSIQREFNSKIQLIAINNESKDSTIHFLQKHNKIKLPALVPFVTGDIILSQHFPHIFVPHHVWVDSNKIIISITYGQNTNISNIRRYMNGTHIDLVRKSDSINRNYSESDLWLAETAKESKALEYYSYITRYIPGIHGSDGTTTSEINGKINKIHVESSPIISLYKIAFGEWRKYDFVLHSNTVLLQLKNPVKYMPPSNINDLDQWNKDNKYSYRLMVPPDRSDQLYSIMQQDIVRYFGINAEIVKRKVECFVLTVRKDQLKKQNYRSKNPSGAISLSFQRLLWLIKLRIDFDASPEPFIDETSFKRDLTVLIDSENWDSWDTMNLQPLQNELNKYGLEIRKEKRLTSVLIIR